ncbi:MAG: hypothetical protein WBN21_15670, partial [Algibacter sp.]
MKTFTKSLKCHKLILVIFLIIGTYSHAQQPFSTRYSEDINGDVTIIANNMVSVDATAPYNGELDNQSPALGNLVYVDIDSDPDTFNSSSANLVNPAPTANCLVIKKVFLYWAASDQEPDLNDPNSENRPEWDFDDIKLMLPGETDYTKYDADEIIFRGRDTHFSNDPYVCVKDITTEVNAVTDPYGTYQVANVEGKIGQLEEHDDDSPGPTGVSGGWQIVFVYESPDLQAKNINIRDGYAHIRYLNPPVDIPFTGFETLPAGDVNAKIVIGTLEGDRRLTNQFQIQNTLGVYTPISVGTVRPSGNFFNSRITVGTSDFTDRDPSSLNTLGFDAAVFDLDNPSNTIIGNSQNLANFRITTDQDTYGLFLIGLAIDIWKPNLGPIQVVTNANSVPQAPGSPIVASFDVENKGNDDAQNVKIFSALPPQLTLQEPILGLPAGVTYTYTYNTVSELWELEFTVEDSYVEAGDPAIEDVEFNLIIQDECYFLKEDCTLSFGLEFTATYNGVINTETQTTKSSSSIDACGVGSETPTIINVIQPTISWDTEPGALDTTLECDDSDGLTTAQGLTPVALTPLGNNCNLIPVKTSGDFVPDASCPNAGTFTNTWTFTDACGVTIADYTQTITLTDTVDPVLANIPAAITISCEDTVPGDSGTVTATDSCSGDITASIQFTAGTLVEDPT